MTGFIKQTLYAACSELSCNFRMLKAKVDFESIL